MSKFKLKTLDSVDLQGKKILLRAAYDITPVEKDGKYELQSDGRIKATIPTINYLLERGCSLGIISWRKRPGGKVVEKYSMKPVAERLAELIGRPVKFLSDCVGPTVEEAITSMKAGEIYVLENTRFHPEEQEADQDFAKQMVRGFELIVYDAFAQAHRVHASTTGILQELPAVSGLLFKKEIDYLTVLVEEPAHPFVALIGGAKISDRVSVMQRLIERADAILIGGAVANNFLAAISVPVENSLIEDRYVDEAKQDKLDYQEVARTLLERGSELVNLSGLTVNRLQLPLDLVAAPSGDSHEHKLVNLDQGDELSHGWAFYDIGPRTIELYTKILSGAKMIFGNGPMGLFEKEDYELGTRSVYEKAANCKATTVIGGGDTESVVERYSLEGKFSHVSTGGGASLEFLAGRELPVMKYLVK